MFDRAQTRFRPQLQPLEDRHQPGTLLVTPTDFSNTGVEPAAPDDVILWNPGAADQSVPFKGAADAVVTAAAPEADGLHLTITEAGQATHLGEFTRAESLVVHADGTITGTGVFTAANGEQVFTAVSGGFTSPTTVAGTYTITGGTGRFAGATGSAAWAGTTPDAIHVAITFDGAISR